MIPNTETYVPNTWQNYANKDATGADSFSETARRLIVGGAGSVYLVPFGSESEKLFMANCPAGMVITQQFIGIGDSTTATDLCVQFD